MNRDKRASQPTTRHQGDRRCMGDPVRQDDVWRNYSGKDSNNSNENMDCSKYNNKKSYNNNSYSSKPYRGSNRALSDQRYGNRHLLPPREPRHSSRQLQEQQPQPISRRSNIWRQKTDDGRNYDNNNYSKPYRGSNGCVGDHCYDNRHLFPPREPRHASRQLQELQQQQQPISKRSDIWRPESADVRQGLRQEQALKQEQNLGPGKKEGVQQGQRQAHSLEMLQQQSAMAQSLLPHWVRMKDLMWMSALRKNDTKEASTTTEKGMAANKHEKPSGPQPKPLTTLAARVISRDGPFGPTCKAYDIKRAENYPLTAEQKQRLRNAIERSEDGQVLAALDLAIQEIRTEIDQNSPLRLEMSPDSIPRHSPCRQEVKQQQQLQQQKQKEAAVIDSDVWTWRTPTPPSPVSEGNDSDLDSCDKTRTFASKSNSTSNAEGGLDLAIQETRTEIVQKQPLMLEMSPDSSPKHSPGRQEVKQQQQQQEQKEAAVFDPAVWTPPSPVSEDSKSGKSSSNAADRSESDFPGTRSSTTDFSQPPFRPKKT
ncbi:Hypothetical predicted protein [Drosophila guanche]|uniref:Uncharacterized protein n=1 Tax=Drosophila guanche TaxID=7266 RepID=A0A3B0JZJ2_DROGU|nr:Hypothetical predicted protein [Drosophila guanche]